VRHLTLRFLALFVVALPSVAVAAAQLTPLSWTSAGVGLPSGNYASSAPFPALPSIPLTEPVTVVSVVSVCVRVNPPIGPSFLSCALQEPVVTTFASGAIVVDRPEFHFEGTLGSVANGNHWTVALVNPVLNLVNPSTVGPLVEGKLVSLQLYVDAFPTAVLTPPDLTAAPVEAVSLRKVPSDPDPAKLPLIEARSATLGSTLSPFAPGFVETFLEGDTITLFGRVSLRASFAASVFNQNVVGVQFTWVDPCGTFNSPTALPSNDCTVGLDLFAPTSMGTQASLACRADLNHDTVVNAQDLASLKSVFFQRCQQ
jgi:hypothetical protein